MGILVHVNTALTCQRRQSCNCETDTLSTPVMPHLALSFVPNEQVEQILEMAYRDLGQLAERYTEIITNILKGKPST